MATIIFDCETDALLPEATRVHCIVGKVCGENRFAVYVPAEQIERAEIWAKTIDSTRLIELGVRSLNDFHPVGHKLVGHNVIGFDIPVIQKLLKYNLAERNEILDTLVLSRYCNPDRPAHSLEYWGTQVRIEKVKIADWQDGTIESYLTRCYTDTLINEVVLGTLWGEFRDTRLHAGFELASFTYEEMCRQERTGALFDVKIARLLLTKIATEMDAIAEEVEPHFGEALLPKAKQPKFPAKPFKKNGDLTVSAQRYGMKIGITDGTALRESLAAGPVFLTAPITLNNPDQVKQYLFKNGWVPTIWRTKKLELDGKKRVSDERRLKRAVKYVNDTWSSPYRDMLWDKLGIPAGFRRPLLDLKAEEVERFVELFAFCGKELPSSPQFCQPVSKTICPNLEKMEGNIAQQILAWMARRNRRGVLTSWLAHPRLAIDQRLPAGAAGITNTHRQRHTVVVNVPQADGKAIYGKEMRSLFIAPPGYVCVGIDASGLENRIAGHYTTPFDGGAYARVLLEGDTHAVNAAAYSAAIGREVSRHESKPITYGTIYGAGPKKVSVMLNVSLAIAKLMTEAFWRANPGLLAYRKHLEQEWERNGRAFIYGLDGRHIRTRSKHSLINAAFQSCGAIVMDRAWAIAKPLLAGFEYQRWGYFHDEYQIYARPEEADRLGQIVVDSIKQAGEYYQLNVPLTGEYKIGKTWGDTH